HSGIVAPRQRGGFVVARSYRHGAGGESYTLELHRGGGRLGRGTVDNHGGHRRGGADRGGVGGALHPVPFAAAAYLCRKSAVRHAAEVWRSRRAEICGRRLNLQGSCSLE